MFTLVDIKKHMFLKIVLPVSKYFIHTNVRINYLLTRKTIVKHLYY